jgi:hypothetical protein
MIEKGEVPMVDAAIFADVKGEPKAVYEWLAYLKNTDNKISYSCSYLEKLKTRYFRRS